MILVLLGTGISRAVTSVPIDLRRSELRATPIKADLVTFKTESYRLNLAPSSHGQKKMGMPFTVASVPTACGVRSLERADRRARKPVPCRRTPLVGVVELRI
ncbi:MAG: hypothetical protein U1F61_17290 [Opitutaceae bacterium]